MKHEQYTTLKGTVQYRPVLTERGMSRIMSDGMGGFCLACGKPTKHVEPDTRQYECPSCHANKVYGIEELLIMGLVRIK